MNEGELYPLYQIADEYLFVIFGQPKYLYVYNLLEHAHNSLVTRMKLDPSYNDLDTYLIIENVKFTSSFYLFVFYGSEKYEVILFEPNNWMLGDIDNESNLFLNQTEIETAFYPDKIVNLTLTPFYANEYPHKEIYPLNLSMNCTNKGLKIQSRHKEDLIEIAQSQENITFSLLDYFDGFNMSYNYDILQGSENETKIYISKEDHQSYYLNQDTVGRHAKAAFIYNDNDLFVFYSSSTQIDRYNILDPINSYKSIENLPILDNCELDYLKYFKINEDLDQPADSIERDLLVVNCMVTKNEVGSSFEIRFYEFKIDAENEPRADFLAKVGISMHVKEIQIRRSTGNDGYFHIIVLSEETFKYDSTLFMLIVEYDVDKPFSLLRYETFTGSQIGFDKFVVESFAFIPNQHYFIVGINDFGMAVFDTSRIEVADVIIFKNLFDDFYDTFSVVSLIPTSENEVRVMLRNQEAFTIYWDDLELSPIDGGVLSNVTGTQRFVNVPSQIATNLVDYSAHSVVQLICYIQEGGFFKGFIRVYNHMNRNNTKSFREYHIGRVPKCAFVHYNSQMERIVIICGDRFYVYNMFIYPFLSIKNTNGASNLKVKITADNHCSNQSLNIHLITQDHGVFVLKIIVVATTIGSVILIITLLKLFFRFCCLRNDTDESSIGSIHFKQERTSDNNIPYGELSSMKRIGYSALINETYESDTQTKENTLYLKEENDLLSDK
ncbi:unnamed protein product [Moneuplotes crassus]|uniref:Uncharacterized protein n=1 Tax=Euplotes crassus TaxID=5936 RepID=A0AAD2DCM5_EUPCR|nr:unnamed protein product [Moneuplotes crassus]